jgi:hypothetical protein
MNQQKTLRVKPGVMNTDPYRKGHAAACGQIHERANPYKEDSQAWFYWLHGHRAGMAHLAAQTQNQIAA